MTHHSKTLFAQLGLKTGKARVLTGRDKEVVLKAATAGSSFTSPDLRIVLGPSAEEKKNPGKNSGRPKQTAKGTSGSSLPGYAVRSADWVPSRLFASQMSRRQLPGKRW